MSSRYSTNYDRFAAVVDSDESDVDDKLAGAAASGSGEDSGVAAAMLRMLGGSSGATPGGAQPTRLAYCRLAPGHDARVLRPVFRTHPRDFVPVADPARGFCHTWGVWQDAPDGDKAAQEAASSEYMNHMMLGNLYIGLEFGRPEQQFVEYLRDRKLARLEAERAARAPLYTSSFVIRYALTRDKWRGLKELVPPVWRRLRGARSCRADRLRSLLCAFFSERRDDALLSVGQAALPRHGLVPQLPRLRLDGPERRLAVRGTRLELDRRDARVDERLGRGGRQAGASGGADVGSWRPPCAPIRPGRRLVRPGYAGGGAERKPARGGAGRRRLLVRSLCGQEVRDT